MLGSTGSRNGQASFRFISLFITFSAPARHGSSRFAIGGPANGPLAQLPKPAEVLLSTSQSYSPAVDTAEKSSLHHFDSRALSSSSISRKTTAAGSLEAGLLSEICGAAFCNRLRMSPTNSAAVPYIFCSSLVEIDSKTWSNCIILEILYSKKKG